PLGAALGPELRPPERGRGVRRRRARLPRRIVSRPVTRTRMRVAVIADTHMPRGGRTLPAEGGGRWGRADLLPHLGDVVAASVLDELRALGTPVEAVYGNMDEPALRELLPQRHVVDADGIRIGMGHVPGTREGRA